MKSWKKLRNSNVLCVKSENGRNLGPCQLWNHIRQNGPLWLPMWGIGYTPTPANMFSLFWLLMKDLGSEWVGLSSWGKRLTFPQHSFSTSSRNLGPRFWSPSHVKGGHWWDLSPCGHPRFLRSLPHTLWHHTRGIALEVRHLSTSHTGGQVCDDQTGRGEPKGLLHRKHCLMQPEFSTVGTFWGVTVLNNMHLAGLLTTLADFSLRIDVTTGADEDGWDKFPWSGHINVSSESRWGLWRSNNQPTAPEKRVVPSGVMGATFAEMFPRTVACDGPQNERPS